MKRLGIIALLIAVLCNCIIVSSAQSIENSYEYLYSLFTNKELPFKREFLKEAKPISFIGEEDPYGLTWVVFVKNERIVQLSGLNHNGIWMYTQWNDISVEKMYLICYTLCLGWESTYGQSNIALCFIEQDDSRSYITSLTSANSFVNAMDEYYKTDSFDETEYFMSYLQDTPKSSCFSAVGYDSNHDILIVEFRDSGSVYIYYEFTAEDWNRFMSAASLGNYHAKYIKNKFEYKRLK